MKKNMLILCSFYLHSIFDFNSKSLTFWLIWWIAQWNTETKMTIISLVFYIISSVNFIIQPTHLENNDRLRKIHCLIWKSALNMRNILILTQELNHIHAFILHIVLKNATKCQENNGKNKTNFSQTNQTTKIQIITSFTSIIHNNSIMYAVYFMCVNSERHRRIKATAFVYYWMTITECLDG